MANEWDENQTITFPVDVTPPERAVCFCMGGLMQRCHICDPEGTMYANTIVRPELSARIIG